MTSISWVSTDKTPLPRPHFSLLKTTPSAVSGFKFLYSGMVPQATEMLHSTCFRLWRNWTGRMRPVLSGGSWRPRLSCHRRKLLGEPEASRLGAEGLGSWSLWGLFGMMRNGRWGRVSSLLSFTLGHHLSWSLGLSHCTWKHTLTGFIHLTAKPFLKSSRLH